MSGHMRTRHIDTENRQTILYVKYDRKLYAIPKRIADKYVIREEDSIPSHIVFAELEEKYTKAGVLLKGLRTREGLTQNAFAKKIGINQSNLSHMENGRRPIGKTMAKRIEQIFGVDYRYFLE